MGGMTGNVASSMGGGSGSMSGGDTTPEDALNLGSRTVEQPRNEKNTEQPKGETAASNESGDTQDETSTKKDGKKKEKPKTNWGNFVSGLGAGATMMLGLMGGANGLLGGNSPLSGSWEAIKETVKYGNAERARVEDEVERIQEQAKERAERARSTESGGSRDSSGDARNTPDVKTKSKTMPPLAGVG